MNFSGQCESFLSLAEAKHYNCGKIPLQGLQRESAQRNKTKRKEEKKTKTDIEACAIH